LGEHLLSVGRPQNAAKLERCRAEQERKPEDPDTSSKAPKRSKPTRAISCTTFSSGANCPTTIQNTRVSDSVAEAAASQTIVEVVILSVIAGGPQVDCSSARVKRCGAAWHSEQTRLRGRERNRRGGRDY
jgi:hypothetical protein